MAPVIGQGLDYSVDIVMCIDGTGSMDGIIEEVKANALSFYRQFVDEMEANLKSVQQLRIKVIVFRDFGVDSEPLVESKFFVLDEEVAEFCDFVNKIEATGGGDLPENSLEALAVAMNSDWVTTGSVRRHVIMLYTDAPALALGEKAGSPAYPAGMPASFAELHEWWEDDQKMERRAKRMLIFAPDTDPWSAMVDWSNTFHTPSQAGKGCEEMDIANCIHLLVNSI